MHASEAKAIVRDGYDRVSLAYRADQPDAAILSQYEGWLSLLCHRIPAGGRVLDLGCGCGVPAASILSGKYSVTGIDISPVQIERARALVPGATFICTDMVSADFASGSFDAVVSFYALIHVPVNEQPSMIGNIARWLKVKGVVIATVGSTAWTGIEENWLGVKGGRMYWSHESAQTYLRWFGQAGVNILQTEFVPEDSGGHMLVMGVKKALDSVPGDGR